MNLPGLFVLQSDCKALAMQGLSQNPTSKSCKTGCLIAIIVLSFVTNPEG
ncbi:MAG: hypothetical protein JWP81_1134 [Ferruginibacter sp.]|nr:hypothetical protein [Ferruginibacter sp.]